MSHIIYMVYSTCRLNVCPGNSFSYCYVIVACYFSPDENVYKMRSHYTKLMSLNYLMVILF